MFTKANRYFVFRVYVKAFDAKAPMEGLMQFINGKSIKIPEDKGDPIRVSLAGVEPRKSLESHTFCVEK